MNATFLFTLVLMGIVLLFMGIRVLFVKGSKMSNHSVGGSRELKKQKVYCIKTQDKLERFQYAQMLKELNKEDKDCEFDYDCDTCPCPKEVPV